MAEGKSRKATHAGPERRDEPRTSLRFALPYRHPGQPETLLSGTVRDINASGLLFSSAARTGVGERITLFLDNLPGSRAGRAVGAQVVRVEMGAGPEEFLLGVKFIGLTPEGRGEIARALERTDVMALLRRAGEAGASDLHLASDHPPLMRLDRQLVPAAKEALAAEDVRDMIHTVLDDHHRQVLERELELDFSLSVPPRWRFRANVHFQRGNVEASFRQVMPQLRSIAELNLPRALEDLAALREGLVVIAGPAGSGKTVAAAAVIEHINATRSAVVVTVENPIEHVYPRGKSVIKQREVGLDTRSCAAALHEAMHQDPDVIFVGELRDGETLGAVIEAAHSGHLVLVTLSAANSVNAILRMFQLARRGSQGDVQVQLANCLRGIVALRLLPRRDVPGLVPATEVMVSTPAIANMIRLGSPSQIRSAIHSGRAIGMHSLESSLERLRRAGLISKETFESARATL